MSPNGSSRRRNYHCDSDRGAQVLPPPPGFAKQANAGPELEQAAEADRLAFWAEQARRLHWDTDFTDVGLVERTVREVVRRRQA